MPLLKERTGGLETPAGLVPLAAPAEKLSESVKAGPGMERSGEQRG